MSDPSKMFSNQERYMVQKLRQAGVPPAKVEAMTGVSQRSIRRIVKEPEVTTVEASPIRRQLQTAIATTIRRTDRSLLYSFEHLF